MRKLLLWICFTLMLGVWAMAQATQGPAVNGAIPVVNSVERADAATSVCHTHTNAATCTISPGPAGSLTQTVYITGIEVTNCAGSAAETAGIPTFVTTTGVNGSPQYAIGALATVGACSTITPALTSPLRSQTPGTNVTFVLPTFVTNQTISVNIYYRLGF